MRATDRCRLTPAADCAGAALAVLLCAASGACDGRAPAPPPHPPAQLPDSGRCPDARRASAEGAALLESARAEMQRSVLEPAAALKANMLLVQAIHCLETAGDAAASTQARKLRADWTRRVEREYALRRLRLARALSSREAAGHNVRLAAQSVLEMLPSAKGRYASWLRGLTERGR